ncbi:MAG: transglutaminase family protein [Gammaproteobacteria bacterium]|nr:transglutaminase family protein [Gammaproteobacteria bacterium]
MNYLVQHKTIYEYSKPVSICQNEARLRPRNFEKQQCSLSKLEINPKPSDIRQREDFFGNRVTYFAIDQPHTVLTVTSSSEVEVAAISANKEKSKSPKWDEVAKRMRSDLQEDILEARQYTLNSPMVMRTRELQAYAERSFAEGRPVVEAVHDLMERIHRDFTYDPHFTTLATPLSDVLKHRRGVCQDFAHLAIGCLRAQGLAAKYISGYLETLPPPGQEKLVGADASHAWFSVYVPDSGWLDFDPTNNQMPMDQHITLAWGRDYSDVTPLKGIIFGGGKHELKVQVNVENLSAEKSIGT